MSCGKEKKHHPDEYRYASSCCLQGPGLTVYGISGYIGPRVGFCLLEQPPCIFSNVESPHPVGSNVHRQLFSTEHRKGCEPVQSKNTFMDAQMDVSKNRGILPPKMDGL